MSNLNMESTWSVKGSDRTQDRTQGMALAMMRLAEATRYMWKKRQRITMQAK